MNTYKRTRNRWLPEEVTIHNLPVQLLFYFVLIPYVYPKGFAKFFPAYKLLFTAWLFAAMMVMIAILAWVGIRRRLGLKHALYWILLYFAGFLLITLIDQLGINDGFQKLFAAPVLCIFTMEAMKEYKYTYISCLANILLVEFILGLTICSPFVMGRYFSESSHLLFMGHVQTASQFGLIAVLLAYFLWRMNQEVLRPLLLFITSLLIMLTSGTIASLIAIGIVLVGMVGSHFPRIRRFALHLKWQFWIYIVLNLVLFTLTVLFFNVDYKVGGISIDLHGRMYIWQAALDIMKDHWLLGYGAYGAAFETFWTSEGSGAMNYAHSQMMQCLVDGGISLTVLFYVMVYSCINQMSLTRKRDLYVPAVIFFAFLMIMLIESMTEYLYLYIFLIMMAYLPEITSLYKKPKYRLKVQW